MMEGYERITLVKMARKSQGPVVHRIGGNPEIHLDPNEREFLIPSDQVLRCLANANLLRVKGFDPVPVVRTPDGSLIKLEQYEELEANFVESKMQEAENSSPAGNTSAAASEVFQDEDEDEDEEDDEDEGES